VAVETLIYGTLRALVNDRVYRDVAKEVTPGTTDHLPRITFQQIGGEAVNFLDSGIPSKRNEHFQINVWGTRRDDVMAVARLAEEALRAELALATTVLGSAVAIYEEDTRLYGSRQDFSFWT